MSGLRILVTGANGFLGRHVARLFARQGDNVVGIGHGSWPRAEWKLWGLSDWHSADVTLENLRRYAGQPEAIIHCAGSGSVSFSISDPLSDFERTVETTAHVMEFVRTSAPGCRVVYPSSASIYGTVASVPIPEDCPAAPISQYGTHKLMAEQIVTSYCRQFGASAAIVRLFSVYGCGLRKQLLWDACHKLASGDNTFMGSGHEVRDWLHVEDAAALLMKASEYASAACPTVNGGTGEGVTVRDVLLLLSSNLLQADMVPKFSGAHRTGDPTRFIAEVQRSKAWGWEPTRRLTEGVKEYTAWWKEESL